MASLRLSGDAAIIHHLQNQETTCLHFEASEGAAALAGRWVVKDLTSSGKKTLSEHLSSLFTKDSIQFEARGELKISSVTTQRHPGEIERLIEKVETIKSSHYSIFSRQQAAMDDDFELIDSGFEGSTQTLPSPEEFEAETKQFRSEVMAVLADVKDMYKSPVRKEKITELHRKHDELCRKLKLMPKERSLELSQALLTSGGKYLSQIEPFYETKLESVKTFCANIFEDTKDLQAFDHFKSDFETMIRSHNEDGENVVRSLREHRQEYDRLNRLYSTPLFEEQEHLQQELKSLEEKIRKLEQHAETLSQNATREQEMHLFIPIQKRNELRVSMLQSGAQSLNSFERGFFSRNKGMLCFESGAFVVKQLPKSTDGSLYDTLIYKGKEIYIEKSSRDSVIGLLSLSEAIDARREVLRLEPTAELPPRIETESTNQELSHHKKAFCKALDKFCDIK